MTTPLTGQRSRSELIAELYERHAAGLFAYCHDQLGETSSAADAVVSIFTGVPTDPSPARAALYALARREIYRRDVSYALPAVDSVADPATALIERVFRDIRPHQREVLLLSAVCGLTTSELSWVFEVATDTAAELTLSARRRFSQTLITATTAARSAPYVPMGVAEVYDAIIVSPIEDVLARLPWRRPAAAVRARVLSSLPVEEVGETATTPATLPTRKLWPTTPAWPLPLTDPNQVTNTCVLPAEALVPPKPGRRSKHEATTEPMPRLRPSLLAAFTERKRRTASPKPSDSLTNQGTETVSTPDPATPAPDSTSGPTSGAVWGSVWSPAHAPDALDSTSAPDSSGSIWDSPRTTAAPDPIAAPASGSIWDSPRTTATPDPIAAPASGSIWDSPRTTATPDSTVASTSSSIWDSRPTSTDPDPTAAPDAASGSIWDSPRAPSSGWGSSPTPGSDSAWRSTSDGQESPSTPTSALPAVPGSVVFGSAASGSTPAFGSALPAPTETAPPVADVADVADEPVFPVRTEPARVDPADPLFQGRPESELPAQREARFPVRDEPLFPARTESQLSARLEPTFPSPAEAPLPMRPEATSPASSTAGFVMSAETLQFAAFRSAEETSTTSSLPALPGSLAPEAEVAVTVTSGIAERKPAPAQLTEPVETTTPTDGDTAAPRGRRAKRRAAAEKAAKASAAETTAPAAPSTAKDESEPEDATAATPKAAKAAAKAEAKANKARAKAYKRRERHYDWAWEAIGFLICVAIAMLVFFSMQTFVTP
ncbi:hypothetical protein ACFY05_19600 [Microtetraspora fusca]|uniref:RNA polymerase sigma factor 70 region 4 type 2 domain-containing protein n=1 Tax=Microtetraspora fusca TaxID=1997 RepID=A0ABW6V6W1_MICFU